MARDPLLPVAVPPPSVIDTLRTAKMAPYGPLGIQTGIDKKPRKDRVLASTLGFPDDEHDLTFHGGPDKAVHQYSSDNYPLWREMFPDPDVSARFVPGGFGENIAAHGWSETNICIGDRVRMGPFGSTAVGGENGALLEVSLPRQPCYKLNQRFGIKNFAPKTIDLRMTGWYYRVVEPGYVQVGDEIRVLDRPNPRWTIERLQRHTHKEKDEETLTSLLEVLEIGKEFRGIIQGAIQKIQKTREPKPVEVFRQYQLVEKRPETRRVVHLVFEAVEKSEKDEDAGEGSHIVLQLPNGLKRAYSVVGGTQDRFELGVAREANSRGGSAYLHDIAKVGDTIMCGSMTESLSLAPMASKHIFIAGGIGITAFPIALRVLKQISYDHMLHYAVQSDKEAAFKDLLEKSRGNYRIYDKSKGERMDIREILKNRVWNSHVFVCGPQRMIDDVIACAKAEGMVDDEVHFENFSAEVGGDPFTATVLAEGEEKELQVGEEETLLEVMRKAGLDVGSSCEVGNCGTCRIGLRSGKVQHRGNALNEEEKKKEMLSCISRGIGHITVEL